MTDQDQKPETRQQLPPLSPDKGSPRILVACEFSGIVREAFRAKGWDAWSCDLLPTEIPGQHIQGDVLEILDKGWDMMIAHPPCTHLAVSGARWFSEKQKDYRQKKAIVFFMQLALANIPMIVIEQPISIISTIWRKPDQIIQPWMFGHGETKATCLWLKNLPLLRPTNIVDGREQKIFKMPPSENRGQERSRTFPGIARAMADQWAEVANDKAEIRRT